MYQYESYVLLALGNVALLLGEYIGMQLFTNLTPDTDIALESRWDSNHPDWPTLQVVPPVCMPDTSHS